VTATDGVVMLLMQQVPATRIDGGMPAMQSRSGLMMPQKRSQLTTTDGIVPAARCRN
jgi:hypothetical protein